MQEAGDSGLIPGSGRSAEGGQAGDAPEFLAWKTPQTEEPMESERVQGPPPPPVGMGAPEDEGDRSSSASWDPGWVSVKSCPGSLKAVVVVFNFSLRCH